MKLFQKFTLLAAAICVAAAGPPKYAAADALPQIRITQLEIAGPVTQGNGGEAFVPLRFIIHNTGGASPVFKLAAFGSRVSPRPRLFSVPFAFRYGDGRHMLIEDGRYSIDPSTELDRVAAKPYLPNSHLRTWSVTATSRSSSMRSR